MTKAPPQIPELKEFEDETMSRIQNIKFYDKHKPFQNQLHTYMNKIKTDTKVSVAADNTNNFSKVDTGSTTN